MLNELKELITELKINPTQGVAIGNSCYKYRISIHSKGKGKSGGARMITNIIILKKEVYLLAIYDKNEKESLNQNELKELLKYIPQ